MSQRTLNRICNKYLMAQGTMVESEANPGSTATVPMHDQSYQHQVTGGKSTIKKFNL